MKKWTQVYSLNMWLMGLSVPAGLLCIWNNYHLVLAGCVLWCVTVFNWVTFWFYKRAWKEITASVNLRLMKAYHDAAV